MRYLSLVTCVAALVAAGETTAQAQAPVKLVAVRCGHLFDAEAGSLLGDTTVVVDGTRIREVLPGNHAPPGSGRHRSVKTQTCLPGLIDSLHTHLTDQTSPTAYVDQFHC